MKIFLTGATGYIGSAVLDAALRANHQITALVRTPQAADALASRGVTPVLGDLSSVKSYRAAAEGHREEGEAVWRCENTSCPAKLQRGLEHFASRGAMNIEGLGESLIVQLTGKELVKSIADLYHLAPDTLEGLERMGKKSAAKVIGEIAMRRQAGTGAQRAVLHVLVEGVGDRAIDRPVPPLQLREPHCHTAI